MHYLQVFRLATSRLTIHVSRFGIVHFGYFDLLVLIHVLHFDYLTLILVLPLSAAQLSNRPLNDRSVYPGP